MTEIARPAGDGPERFGAPALDAIILAGGRASRLDGIDKPALIVGGKRLVDRAIDAANAFGACVVVTVGPHRARAAETDGAPGSRVAPLFEVREDPPFGGPVAALAAGLAKVDAPLLLVLAADLPSAELAADRLTPAVGIVAGGTGDEDGDALDGAVLVDESGRDQWLTGVYRAGPLRSAIDRLDGATAGAPLRAVMRHLRLQRIPADGTAVDIDTWADAERHGAVDPTTGVLARPAVPDRNRSEQACGLARIARGVPSRATSRSDEGEKDDRHHPR